MSDASASAALTGRAAVRGAAEGTVVGSDTALSFWGGVDTTTGCVIDRHHPLRGQSLAGRVLALPESRGSCTGSAVLLELLLNDHAPAAILLARADEILTLGVVVAEELFGRSIPVVELDPAGFEHVRAARHVRVRGERVLCDGAGEDIAGQPDRGPPAAARLELTPADRALLDGVHGRAAQVAMRILVRMATLEGAERLIDITRVHIDGCIYSGPGSLWFAQRFRDWGGRVAVPTTLNAISVDHRHWRAQGVDPAMGEPASRLADAYVDMGAQATFTCAPYDLDDPPRRGEQIAWAESNAVINANSVIGARTLKYPDYLDLCIALTGRAPLTGCHVESNRRAELCVRVPKADRADDAFHALLGYHVGAVAGHRVPAILGLEDTAPSPDDLKAMSAAFGTTSGAPMFHLVGVTPEAATLAEATGGTAAVETVEITVAELRATRDSLNGAGDAPIDLVSLGNPHASLHELARLAELCRGRTRHPEVRLVVTCGRAVLERAREAGLVAALEAFGVRFVTDTCWCMIGEPLIPPGASTIMTNSAKYAHYGPGLTGRAFRFGGLADCVEAACTRRADPRPPGWLR